MQGTASCRFCGELWVQLRGCKGRSPLHKKTKSLPLPAGKSALRARVGGMGATKQAKGRGSRRQRRQAPLRTPQRHGQPATSRVSPPADTTAARSAGDQSGKLPHRIQQRQVEPATKKHPLTPKETRFTLDRLPAFMYNYNEKGGSMARIPPPDTRFEQFVKIRICIDNHVTACYNSDTAEEPRRNAP